MEAGSGSSSPGPDFLSTPLLLETGSLHSESSGNQRGEKQGISEEGISGLYGGLFHVAQPPRALRALQEHKGDPMVPGVDEEVGVLVGLLLGELAVGRELPDPFLRGGAVVVKSLE